MFFHLPNEEHVIYVFLIKKTAIGMATLSFLSLFGQRNQPYEKTRKLTFIYIVVI